MMKGTTSFRASEKHILNLISEAASDEEWHALLKRTLEYAAGNGKSTLIVKLMRAMGVVRVPGVFTDVRDSIGDALRAAIGGGHAFIVGMMLEHVGRNYDIDSLDGSGETIMHVAARRGKDRIIRLLSQRGANLNVQNGAKKTPLYMAVTSRRSSAVEVLISQGVDTSITYGIYNTPVIHLAAQLSSDGTRILRTLLEHGADANALDDKNQTALHFAAGVAYSAKTMRVLIRAGANVNAQKMNMCTPIHSASRYLKPVAVDTLLRHGALEDLVDKNGKTAADVVGERIKKKDRNEADVDRVRHLLASANIDRIWRRRAPLLLCRSPVAPIKRLRCWTQRQDQDEWQGVLLWLLSPHTPEGIFRSVVAYIW